jgi:hypothetical protein
VSDSYHHLLLHWRTRTRLADQTRTQLVAVVEVAVDFAED